MFYTISRAICIFPLHHSQLSSSSTITLPFVSPRRHPLRTHRHPHSPSPSPRPHLQNFGANEYFSRQNDDISDIIRNFADSKPATTLKRNKQSYN